jgi:hypothetical protein
MEELVVRREEEATARDKDPVLNVATEGETLPNDALVPDNPLLIGPEVDIPDGETLPDDVPRGPVISLPLIEEARDSLADLAVGAAGVDD